MSNTACVVTRRLLRLWARTDIAIGYQYVAVERLAPKSPTPVSTHLPNGCVMTCDLSEHVERQIYFQGVYEPIEARLFTMLAQPGMVVVDAGSNVGQYSLLASTLVDPTGEVHSFEPSPRNFGCLREHIVMNRLTNVRANQRALWHQRETLTFGIPEGYANNSGSFRSQVGGIEVQALPLDEYARDFKRLDLIKIDVEGAEPLVLKGAMDTLRKFRPTLLMEVNREALEAIESSPEALWMKLQALGYRASLVAMRPEDRVALPDFANIQQVNILAYAGEAPHCLTESWTIHDALRWARSGW